MESDRDIFLGRVQGRVIHCESVQDAIAINTVDALLKNSDVCTASELQRLGAVLVRYHCHDEAEKLSHLASRPRAMQLLTGSVGYERPNNTLSSWCRANSATIVRRDRVRLPLWRIVNLQHSGNQGNSRTSLFKLLLQALFFGKFSLLKDLIGRDMAAMLNDAPLFSLLHPNRVGEERIDLPLPCQPQEELGHLSRCAVSEGLCPVRGRNY